MLFASVAALLVAVDIGLVLYNQSIAAAVARRREFIAQRAQLARAVQVMATTPAQAAVRTDDPAVRNLLSANGITLSLNAPSPMASTQTAPARSP